MIDCISNAIARGARAAPLGGGRACARPGPGVGMADILSLSTLSRFADPVRRHRASSLMLDRLPFLFIYL